MTGIIYAVDDHHRDDLPWPVPASHWFWSHGQLWHAVVADWHEDWWEGADPRDIAERPDVWSVPINETPSRSGIMIYRDAGGVLHHKEFVATSDAEIGVG